MFAVYFGSVVFVTLVMQTTFFGPFGVACIQPDLCLLATLYFGLYWNLSRSLTAGFTLGLLQDALGGGLFGYNLLSKTLYAALFSIIQRHIGGASWPAQLISAVLVTFFDGLLYLGVSGVASPFQLGLAHALPVLVAQTAYTGLVAPPMILTLELARRRFRLIPDVSRVGAAHTVLLRSP